MGFSKLTYQNGAAMIELYMRDGCPFCQKVIQTARDLGLKEGGDFTVIDAAQGTPGREVVLTRGGKGMVPFMIDGDLSMYESVDIIEYLKLLSPLSGGLYQGENSSMKSCP